MSFKRIINEISPFQFRNYYLQSLQTLLNMLLDPLYWNGLMKSIIVNCFSPDHSLCVNKLVIFRNELKNQIISDEVGAVNAVDDDGALFSREAVS